MNAAHTPEEWAAAEALVAGTQDAETDESTEPEATTEDEAEATPDADADDAPDDEDEDGKPKQEPPKVAIGERAKFREQKRKWNAAKQEQEQQIAQQRQALAPLIDVARKLDDDDFEGALEHVESLLARKDGREPRSFQQLMQLVVERAKGKDPRVTKLEKQLAQERQQREQEALKQREEQARIQKQQREQAFVQQNIVAPLKTSSGPAKHLAELPAFANDVFRVLLSHHDPDTDTTVTLDSAVAEVLPRYQKVYASLARAFGDHPAKDEQAPSGAAAPAKRRGIPRANHRRAADAAPRGGQMTDDEWLKMGTEQMLAAFAKDAATK